MPRQIIVVDIETTGLHPKAAILEVAAVNVDTGEELCFAPHVDRQAFAEAEGTAMQINRYFERGVHARMLSQDYTALRYTHLREMLTDNVFAASNPAFDSRHIARAQWTNPGEYVAFGMKALTRDIGTPWHYRMLDLSAYAAGVLALDPTELPGAHAVCELLGVENEEEHSALGDARATAECFRRLMAMNEGLVRI